VKSDDFSDWLTYHPDTGIFNWKKSPNQRIIIGAVAGTVKQDYIVIQLNGKLYRAHRLAWFMTFGYWPILLDHKNCNKTDNRINNLREATQAQNLANQGLRSNNTSGIKGVCWMKKAQKWHAVIVVNKKRVHLGLFSNLEDAKAAREQANSKYQAEYAYE